MKCVKDQTVGDLGCMNLMEWHILVVHAARLGTGASDRSSKLQQFVVRLPPACIDAKAGCWLLVPEAVWLAVNVRMASNGIANFRELRFKALPGGESVSVE